MKRLALLLVIVCTPLVDLFGQTYRKAEINIENFIEELFGQQKEDANYEELYETLLQVLLQPIDLNLASEEDLQSLYILNPSQIKAFMQYRQLFGPLISLYELQAIPDWDLELIQKLLPFIKVEEGRANHAPLLKRVATARDSYFLWRTSRTLETRRGFTAPDTLSGGRLSSRYLGDPFNLYSRLRIQQSKDFSLGFTMEKDAGEQWIVDPSTNRYGFNFFSYHLTLHRIKNWKTITLGDYQLQFGQGLVFGAGFAVGKGAQTIATIRRSSVGIRPYTAAMETGFFRGAAATYQKGNVQVTLMASNSPRDGNIQWTNDTLTQERASISSLPLSGLHRTFSEISNRNQIREKNLGGNLHFSNANKNLQLGINSLITQFSLPIERTPRTYNQFEFRGDQNHIHSFYFSYGLQNHYFFGESAFSKSGGIGHTLGLMSALHPKLDFSALWRRFDRDFHSFYGNAFSENSRPINEEGLYLGLNIRPSKKWNLSGYYDRFRFPWLRFRAYGPSEGSEWLSRISYTPSRKTLLFIQLREENKARNISIHPNFQQPYELFQGKRLNTIINLDHAIDKHWSIKSRVSSSSFRFDNRTTKGFAISQDINFDSGKWRVSSRWVLFDTDDFDNRQYIYERNVLWYFSIPALHGQGMRYYLLGQYQLGRKTTIWARWARTSFTDREQIGSGLQRIEGSRQTDVVLQLRHQFNR